MTVNVNSTWAEQSSDLGTPGTGKKKWYPKPDGWYYRNSDSNVFGPLIAPKVNALGSIGGGTQDIDLTLGNIVTGTVDTSATTFTFSNPPATGLYARFTMVLTNGGSQTITWPAGVDWVGGVEPAWTLAGVDLVDFWTIDGGTTWYGVGVHLDMK